MNVRSHGTTRSALTPAQDLQRRHPHPGNDAPRSLGPSLSNFKHEGRCDSTLVHDAYTAHKVDYRLYENHRRLVRTMGIAYLSARVYDISNKSWILLR